MGPASWNHRAGTTTGSGRRPVHRPPSRSAPLITPACRLRIDVRRSAVDAAFAPRDQRDGLPPAVPLQQSQLTAAWPTRRGASAEDPDRTTDRVVCDTPVAPRPSRCCWGRPSRTAPRSPAPRRYRPTRPVQRSGGGHHVPAPAGQTAWSSYTTAHKHRRPSTDHLRTDCASHPNPVRDFVAFVLDRTVVSRAVQPRRRHRLHYADHRRVDPGGRDDARRPGRDGQLPVPLQTVSVQPI